MAKEYIFVYTGDVSRILDNLDNYIVIEGEIETITLKPTGRIVVKKPSGKMPKYQPTGNTIKVK